MNASLTMALKRFFGFEAFRPGQEAVVRDAMADRDVLALMPTGGGKSLCYQLPAVLQPGVSIVVSPLIALMQDQVRQLLDNDIAATFINSSLDFSEVSRRIAGLIRGEFKLVYLAPERLVMTDFLEGPLQDLSRGRGINGFIIDEAHCVSEWGHDFRPEYRQLSVLRRRHSRVPVLAFTATATPRVRTDIIRQLGLRDAAIHLSSFNRPNLFYRAREKSKQSYAELLQQARSGGTGIVYCLSRRRVDELAARLLADGLRTRPYHAGLDPDVRRDNQDAFIRDDIQVIVATVAFGMGINKPDVRWVIHYDLPKSLEGYYQESGRAGRDGDPAFCTLYYGPQDIRTAEYLIQQKIDPISGAPLETEQRIAREQLSRVLSYARSDDCRRAIQLRYFDEAYETPCGFCDNCREPKARPDASVQARQFVSCIARLAQRGERFGAAHIIDILRGARTERLLRRGHDTLSVYGIGSRQSLRQWRSLAEELVEKKLVDASQDGYSVLSLNAASWELMRNERSVDVSTPARVALGGLSIENSHTGESGDRLFDRLRALRKQLADEQGLPPYVIFHDATLREIAALRPRALSQFAAIRGVGEAKLARYGRRFVEALRKFEAETTPG